MSSVYLRVVRDSTRHDVDFLTFCYYFSGILHVPLWFASNQLLFYGSCYWHNNGLEFEIKKEKKGKESICKIEWK